VTSFSSAAYVREVGIGMVDVENHYCAQQRQREHKPLCRAEMHRTALL